MGQRIFRPGAEPTARPRSPISARRGAGVVGEEPQGVVIARIASCESLRAIPVFEVAFVAAQLLSWSPPASRADHASRCGSVKGQ